MPKTETGLDSIKCPGCGEVIPISETIYHQVVESAERELKAKSVRQERALAEREEQLQAREHEFDRRVQEQVNAVAADLKSQAEQQARQSVSLELEDLKRQTADKDEKLRAAEQAELQLRKQKRELEERERRLELDTARKLDEERRKIEDQAVRQVEDRHRLDAVEWKGVLQQFFQLQFQHLSLRLLRSLLKLAPQLLVHRQGVVQLLVLLGVLEPVPLLDLPGSLILDFPPLLIQLAGGVQFKSPLPFL